MVICGDMNVAHREIDIARPKDNVHNAGFTKEERQWFTEVLDHGYLDTVRIFNSEADQYTWWSYRFNARARNIGWRIDYFVVSSEIFQQPEHPPVELKLVIKPVEFPLRVWEVYVQDIPGSDHAPIRMVIEN